MENKRATGGFVGTAVGVVMTALQGTHPEWFGNHLWILPVSLLILFVSLLLWITQISWVQRILGLSYAAASELKDGKRVELASAWNDLESSIDSGLHSARLAGAQARLLWHFEAEARWLERFLVEIFDKWNYVGEHLTHPISTEIADWKDHSSTHKCEFMLRNFKCLYTMHLEYVRLEFPGFTSSLLGLGYPSNAEYHDVLFAIKDHAEALDSVAKQIWDANEPMREIDSKRG